MILLHGTTRFRAEQIVERGPNPKFLEPGGKVLDSGFSMNLAAGPFLFGTPEDYAKGKAREFPNEGEAVILILDIPDEIVLKAASVWFPLSQGLVQFDSGAGLEELVAAWSSVKTSAEIRSVR